MFRHDFGPAGRDWIFDFRLMKSKMNNSAHRASQYHRLTSYHRNKMSGHFLDWENQPSLYKTYPQAESVPLPREVKHPESKLSQVLKGGSPEGEPPVPDMDDLSRILSLAFAVMP